MNAYGVLMLAGIIISAWLWGRMHGRVRGHHDARLTVIYFAGLIGAIIGAKLAFLFAEGWAYRENMIVLASGWSITGGLLGGYAAVEIAKHRLDYSRTTGDVFAIIVPVAIALGRIGCALRGCCPGVECAEPAWWTMIDLGGTPRWPAQWAEFTFNVLFIIWALIARRRNWFAGSRFHIYLIAYGLFRFAHGFFRDTYLLIEHVSGYQIIALAMMGFGAWRLLQRSATTAHRQ